LIVVVVAACYCCRRRLLRPFSAHSLTRPFDADVAVSGFFFRYFFFAFFLLPAISKADVVVGAWPQRSTHTLVVVGNV